MQLLSYPTSLIPIPNIKSIRTYQFGQCVVPYHDCNTYTICVTVYPTLLLHNEQLRPYQAIIASVYSGSIRIRRLFPHPSSIAPVMMI